MESDKDVVIIGGGIAGLSAGLYTSWKGLSTLVIDRMAGTGGSIVNAGTIVNYPGFPGGISGPDLGAKLAEHAIESGVSIEYGEVEQLRKADAGFEAVCAGEIVQSRVLMLAMGATPRKLGCPGEETFVGQGVSFCATCDAPLFKGEPVVVVGDGDNALDDALYASQTSPVHLLVRGPQLSGAARLAKEVLANSSISISWNTTVAAVEGSNGVESVRVLREGREESLRCAAVFVAIGVTPSTGLVQDLVSLDADGYVHTDTWMRSIVPGLFAVGDVRMDFPGQLVTGAADGATAAIAAHRFLTTGDWR